MQNPLFTLNWRVILVAAALVLFWAYTLDAFTSDELTDEEIYCTNVKSGLWPDFKDQGKLCAPMSAP
jgi:hypothetical protein